MTEIEELALTTDRGSLRYLLALGESQTAGVLVVVHGQGRSVDRLVDAFVPFASRAGFAVVAPIFSDTLHRGYQRLAGAESRDAASGGLTAICEDVFQRLRKEPSPVAVVGYSGGAQFAHRYAMAVPSRVRRVVVAGAGWYTMPDPTVAFPYGCGSSIDMPAGMPNLDEFLAKPIRVMVGEADVERDADLRKSPALDQHQGMNRLERAQRWTESVRCAAIQRGITPRISFELLPNSRHSVADAIRKGKFVERTIDFCLGGAAR